jgi:glucose-1-phosphate thymidylyltransferase
MRPRSAGIGANEMSDRKRRYVPKRPKPTQNTSEGLARVRHPGLRSLCMEVKGVIVVEDSYPSDDSAYPCRAAALEHVANRPILHHVLDTLTSAGVDEVIVASSVERANAVRTCLEAAERRNGIRLVFVETPNPVDLVAALELAAPIVGDAPCIVHLANGLLADPLPPLVRQLRGDSPDVVLILHHGSAPDERLSPATQEMLHVAELDPERDALGMAGVCFFGRDALRQASTAPWRAGNEFDLTMVCDRITGAGGSFHVLPATAWHRYAGDPLDLLELNRIALDCLDAEPHRPSNNGTRIEGRVCIHQTASVRASVIVGPTVIGPDARLADAYIGPYTAIGARAQIEGAEIERSIVADGACITHVGGRIVASVVGRNARVFRDFSLPRALRLRVGDGTEIALC